jgi:succinate dehydrogenase / fumarate reductase flavoprotein subunit
MSNVPGLFVLGEANFSDHGANRLGASALMQGLADGYFVIPQTIGNYLSKKLNETISTDDSAFESTENDVMARVDKILSINGSRTVDDIHKELGKLLWENVGMSRNKSGLELAIKKIPELRDQFWNNVRIPGSNESLNPELEKAGRLADFLELGETMARDALSREESCGGHFREEHQTKENEAQRDDENYRYVTAWEYQNGNVPVHHKEELNFENVSLTTRSYK